MFFEEKIKMEGHAKQLCNYTSDRIFVSLPKYLASIRALCAARYFLKNPPLK